MKISTERPRQVTLSGQLDSKGAGRIYDELVAFCRCSMADLVLDLRDVKSCTRAGSGVLFVVAKLLQQNGARLRIKNARSAVLETIFASGFDHLLVLEACPGDRGQQPRTLGSILPSQAEDWMFLERCPS